ncbi:MAG: UvrD-helicase domain-containing protein [Oceanococcaceae bacterium]
MIDAQARSEALDLGRSFCVRAPAGSGKTGLLISRMLAALATVDQPEQVLAITFTRKAAAEIRERVTAALQTAAIGPPPEDAFGQQLHRLASAVLHRDAEQGWSLHLSPQRIRATTIDSLNRELARQMPVLSGLGSNLAPIDDARELYRSALQAALGHLEDPDCPPALRASLEATLALGQNRLDALLESLSPLLATRERWLQGQQDQSAQALIDAARQDLSRWTETALQDLDRALYSAARSEWLQALGQLAEAGVPDWQELKGLSRWPGCSPAELPTWQALVRSLLTKSGGWRSPKGLRSNTGFPKGPATSQAQELIEEFRSLSAADCEAQLKRLLLLPGEVDPQSCTDSAQLLAFLRLGAAELRLRFANERACDHTEVALAALQALALPASGAALQADQRLRHVLVDEMQDTSDAQLALLQKLVADWDPEQESAPRTLFLVGDPQQSIYRFRQARVSRFAALLEPGARIGPVLLHRLQLERNFRSDPELVHWCNTQLEQAFERERSPIPFAPGQPTQAPSPGAQVQWHALTDAAEEAKAVCVAVRTLREQEPTARIAILGRTRGHLKPIAEALRAAGLPCAGVELEPLARTPAIRDYLALVRVLHQPLDDIAWLRLLRSPSLALPWADCDALVAKLPGLRWVERLQAEADPTAPAAWLRLRQSWQQVSPQKAVARMGVL